MILTKPKSELSRRQPGFHLTGNYSPVIDEVVNDKLRLTGYLPEELNGVYLRNGPNPRGGYSPHWFLGDGMLHGVRLANGKAEWYQNRYVETEFQHNPNAPIVNQDLTFNLGASRANHGLIQHHGRLLTLFDTAWPIEVDTNLNTIGSYDLNHQLNAPVSSHPKVCSVTDEMLFFSTSLVEPFLTFHRVSPDGKLIHSEPIRVDGPTLIHDFAVTESHIIFFVFPVALDPTILSTEPIPYRWNSKFRSRLGMMPREVGGRPGGNADIRWFDIRDGFVFHFLNAYEHPGDSLSIHGIKYYDMWRNSSRVFDNEGYLTQWIVDLVGMKVVEVQKDDHPVEMPKIPPEYTGIRARYGYAVGTHRAANTLVKFDLTRNTTQIHDFGPDRFPGEAIFVRANGAISEDDGYVMSLVYDRTTETSDLVILDGRRLNGRPLVTVHLEHRVPYGFHGTWVDDVKKPKPRTYYGPKRRRPRRRA